MGSSILLQKMMRKRSFLVPVQFLKLRPHPHPSQPALSLSLPSYLLLYDIIFSSSLILTQPKMASQFRDSRYSFLLLLVSSLHLVRAIHVNCSSSHPRARELAQSCNVFHGSWVLDGSNPLYDSSKCPYIDPEFDCKKYGRPDSMYLKYKWKPTSCELPKQSLIPHHDSTQL